MSPFFISDTCVIDFRQVASMCVSVENGTTATKIVFKSHPLSLDLRVTGPDDLFPTFAAWAKVEAFK